MRSKTDRSFYQLFYRINAIFRIRGDRNRPQAPLLTCGLLQGGAGMARNAAPPKWQYKGFWRRAATLAMGRKWGISLAVGARGRSQEATAPGHKARALPPEVLSGIWRMQTIKLPWFAYKPPKKFFIRVSALSRFSIDVAYEKRTCWVVPNPSPATVATCAR